MDDAHRGELTMLKQKYLKLRKENCELKNELNRYKSREHRIKQNIVKRSKACSGLKNIIEETEYMNVDVEENNYEMVQDIIREKCDFDVFKEYSHNYEIMNKFGGMFVKKRPLKMVELLRNVEIRKITDKDIIAFYNKFVRE